MTSTAAEFVADANNVISMQDTLTLANETSAKNNTAKANFCKAAIAPIKTTIDSDCIVLTALAGATEEEVAKNKCSDNCVLQNNENFNNSSSSSSSNNNNNEKLDNSNDSSHGQEKCDAPENLDKFEADDVTTENTPCISLKTSVKQKDAHMADTTINSLTSTETAISPIMDDSLKQSYAFTIDYMNDKKNFDPDVKAAKYKNMLQRFQNRHRRGASMSKIENSTNYNAVSPTTTTASVTAKGNNLKKPNTPTSTANETSNVENKITLRGRSTPRTSKDFSKRRSWSPHAFEHNKEATVLQRFGTRSTVQRNERVNEWKKKLADEELETYAHNNEKQQKSNVQQQRQHLFIPRSTVMQLAMQKLCTQPLLDDFKTFNLEGNDNASDTGTYTLDGDNYTEEQKDQMNIDKGQLSKAYKYNVMLMNSSTPQMVMETEDSDIGCITSVTTSGILAKNTNLRYIEKTNNINNKNNNISSSLISCVHGNNKPSRQFYGCDNELKEKILDTAILKTAHTKKDWVQEWARNARARSLANDYVSSEGFDEINSMTSPSRSVKLMTQSFISTAELTHNQNAAKRYFLHGSFSERACLSPRDTRSDHISDSSSLSLKSPKHQQQQTKIPSPLNSNRRARSTSRLNNSSYYGTNSLESPLPRSPTHFAITPKATSFSLPPTTLQRSSVICTQLPQKPVHHNLMTNSYNEQQMTFLSGCADETRARLRKNSLDGTQTTRQKAHQQQFNHQRNLYTNDIYGTPKSTSSSNYRKMYDYYDDELEYTVQDLDELSDMGGDMHEQLTDNKNEYDDEQLTMSADPVLASHYEQYQQALRKMNDTVALDCNNLDREAMPPLTTTRYNKTLLMRIQNSKNKTNISNNEQLFKPNGIVACPNTPELPRRNDKKTQSIRTRHSEPRDTNISRREIQLPKSLALAKKQWLQTAANDLPLTTTPTAAARTHSGSSVQPKYLDISKFKQPQANQFLRKNEGRSTLKAPTVSNTSQLMKRSPSASGLSRTDSTRGSKNSIRSVPVCMTSSGTTLSGNINGLGIGINNCNSRQQQNARNNIANKQKEVEMAMWKRRSTYDPMRAAAEDRRRKELKKQELAQRSNEN